MSDKSNDDPKLDTCSTDEAELVVHMVNDLGKYFSVARMTEDQPRFDAMLMAALVVFCGCINGELSESGMVEDGLISDEGVIKMLLSNFRNGEEAGRSKTRRSREAMIKAKAMAEAEEAKLAGREPN